LLALAPLLALMAADVVMATLAIRSDPGLVADAPRRVGLARVSPEATLRLSITATAPTRRQEGQGSRELLIGLTDAEGMAVETAVLEGRLERTTHAGSDRTLDFEAVRPGTWRAVITLPDAGSWQASIAARDAQGRSGLAVLRLTP
jgi:nitrogen fixation protein FixH